VDWAAFRRALIIEDDYDAEFRYDRDPVRAIQGLAPDRVAYVGTVSKTLAPALRLGWIVAPGSWIDELATAKRLADDFTPALDQLALQLFFKSGEYDRHLRRARAAYAIRRSRLVTALVKGLPALPVEGIAAGVHLVLPLPAGADDKAIAADARDAGIVFQALSEFSIKSRRPGLVIGYGRLHESAIDGAVDALRSVVARHL
jgi:GntR family transcriptional regulator/MocR family aminotransferase